jgi:hypothetical protein
VGARLAREVASKISAQFGMKSLHRIEIIPDRPDARQ